MYYEKTRSCKGRVFLRRDEACLVSWHASSLRLHKPHHPCAAVFHDQAQQEGAGRKAGDIELRAAGCDGAGMHHLAEEGQHGGLRAGGAFDRQVRRGRLG